MPLQIKPTWASAAEVIGIALQENNATATGRMMALEELRNMARAADHAVAMQRELEGAQAELERVKANFSEACGIIEELEALAEAQGEGTT